MDARFQQVFLKATRFTASRKLSPEETEELLGKARLVPFETLDPRLKSMNDLGVFDMRCIEYLQECFSSHQVLSTGESARLWLYINHLGTPVLVKLDRSKDTISIHRLAEEDAMDTPNEVAQRLLHWLWLRLASNC